MSDPLWTYPAFLEATAGSPIGRDPELITELSIDSRTLLKGDAFFAIRGDRFDGHDYVGGAFSRGASLVVVSRERLTGLRTAAGAMVVVNDVMAAMRGLAAASRLRSSAEIIAVTGSVGKTTTKDMLGLALSRSGKVHAAPASFNNHWGVPLTLGRMPVVSDFGVFEIGMNNPGEIGPLANLVRPGIAIVTMIAAGHLGSFGGVDDIARAKAEIFIEAGRGGTAILNRDDAHFEILALIALERGWKMLSFGEHADADAKLIDRSLEPSKSVVRASIGGREVRYALSAPGAHLVQNSLAVLAAVQAAGADVDEAAESLAGFSVAAGRGDRSVVRIGTGSALIIDESYNANPASMLAALDVLARAEPGEGGRRIVVLGDMLELGDEELPLHIALADPILAGSIDRVYLAGPRMAALWEALPQARRAVYAELATELVPALVEDIRPGDVVMIKGSNGTRLGSVVQALKQRLGIAAVDVQQGS